MLATPHTTVSEPAPRACGDRDLPALLHRASEPVVVESHFAGWDRPWRGLTAAAWQEILREFGERVNGAVLETGANRELAVRFGLEIIPSVLVFSGGEVVARFSGSVRVADVIAAVRAALARERELDAGRRELAAVSAARAAPTPLRSVAHRLEAEPSLARAG